MRQKPQNFGQRKLGSSLGKNEERKSGDISLENQEPATFSSPITTVNGQKFCI